MAGRYGKDSTPLVILNQSTAAKIDRGTFILAVRRIKAKGDQGVKEYVEIGNWIKRNGLGGDTLVAGKSYWLPLDAAAEVAKGIADALSLPYDGADGSAVAAGNS